MNQILRELRTIVDRERARWLPEVTDQELEESGALFYMNGQNGTEFDWFVNHRFPFFMMFYNNKDHLGAVKLGLSSTGELQVYVYGEKGKKLIQTTKEQLKIDRTELLKCAAGLTREADNKKIWDRDIEKLCVDLEITEEELLEFSGREKNYTVIKNRFGICNLSAVVSKKIVEEGWKVGFMERTEPRDADDSGWFFAAGNEDDAYLSDPKNLMLLIVGMVWQQLDRDIFVYIDRPAGTRLIRTAPDRFEVDRLDQEIYTMKR